MKKKFSFILSIIAIALLLSVFPGQMTLSELSIEDLVREAEDIVIGEVLSLECGWNENRSQIYTYLTLQVKRNLTGELINEIITVKYPGGRMGKDYLAVSDSPSFREHEEVILFLTNGEEPGTKVVVGGAQGKFPTLKMGNERMVIWEGKEVSLVRFEGTIKRILKGQGR